MKFSFHQEYARNAVGTLLYNMLINPDVQVTRVKTTKYGFENVTYKLNSTHICLNFIAMGALAHGKFYTVDEICGFDYRQLEIEFRHWLIPRLSKYNYVRKLTKSQTCKHVSEILQRVHNYMHDVY